MHLTPSIDGIPEAFVRCRDLDFYMYQSGHTFEEQTNSYRFAQVFYNMPVKRPIVNGEPCYEGSGRAFRRERFSAFEVRMAIWQSLLSGAKAGVTYGAHGIWSFHRKDMRFTSEDFSGRPFPWREALRFTGAWDAAFAKWVYETFSLFTMEPKNIIENNPDKARAALQNINMKPAWETGDMDGFRMSENDRHVIIYAPYNFDVVVNGDYREYDYSIIILADRRLAKPQVIFKDGKTIFKMHSFNSDILIIGTKRS